MFKAIIFHPGSTVFFLCYYNVALHVGLGRMASVSFSAKIYNKNLNYAIITSLNLRFSLTLSGTIARTTVNYYVRFECIKL